MADALLRRIGRELGVAAPQLLPDALATIERAPWPGNARELANALERALILSEGQPIATHHLGLATADTAGGADEGGTPEALDRHAIGAALGRHGGNRRAAAEELGIGLRTLYEKLKRYEIE